MFFEDRFVSSGDLLPVTMSTERLEMFKVFFLNNCSDSFIRWAAVLYEVWKCEMVKCEQTPYRRRFDQISSSRIIITVERRLSSPRPDLRITRILSEMMYFITNSRSIFGKIFSFLIKITQFLLIAWFSYKNISNLFELSCLMLLQCALLTAFSNILLITGCHHCI